MPIYFQECHRHRVSALYNLRIECDASLEECCVIDCGWLKWDSLNNLPFALGNLLLNILAWRQPQELLRIITRELIIWMSLKCNKTGQHLDLSRCQYTPNCKIYRSKYCLSQWCNNATFCFLSEFFVLYYSIVAIGVGNLLSCLSGRCWGIISTILTPAAILGPDVNILTAYLIMLSLSFLVGRLLGLLYIL